MHKSSRLFSCTWILHDANAQYTLRWCFVCLVCSERSRSAGRLARQNAPSHLASLALHAPQVRLLQHRHPWAPDAREEGRISQPIFCKTKTRCLLRFRLRLRLLWKRGGLAGPTDGLKRRKTEWLPVARHLEAARARGSGIATDAGSSGRGLRIGGIRGI